MKIKLLTISLISASLFFVGCGSETKTTETKTTETQIEETKTTETQIEETNIQNEETTENKSVIKKVVVKKPVKEVYKCSTEDYDKVVEVAYIKIDGKSWDMFEIESKTKLSEDLKPEYGDLKEKYKKDILLGNIDPITYTFEKYKTEMEKKHPLAKFTYVKKDGETKMSFSVGEQNTEVVVLRDKLRDSKIDNKEVFCEKTNEDWDKVTNLKKTIFCEFENKKESFYYKIEDNNTWDMYHVNKNKTVSQEMLRLNKTGKLKVKYGKRKYIGFGIEREDGYVKNHMTLEEMEKGKYQVMYRRIKCEEVDKKWEDIINPKPVQ